MTDTAALDRAVRELTSPKGRRIMVSSRVSHDYWRSVMIDEIRERCRELTK